MNIIDKTIEIISPGMALKRAHNRYKLQAMENIQNSGYSRHGANTYKKSVLGWFFRGGSHKEDIEENLDILRDRSRDLFMGGANIATGAIKTMRTNVVGVGLKLKSTIDREYLGLTDETAEKLERDIEREFALWADSTSCDIQRLDNFVELQQLAFLNWLLSGDVLATLPTTRRAASPYDLRINLIEGDRLCNPANDLLNPNIVAGVENNEVGEVVAYHVAKHHPKETTSTIAQEWVRVEAYGFKTGRKNVLHIMNRERIGQVRGVPFIAPVIENLKQLGRYTEAELMAAVISGMYTIFIEKEAFGDGGAVGQVVPEEMQVDGEDERSLEIGNGVVLDLEPGEKAHDMNPGRPNTAFDGFVTSMCRQIGAALEIPFEILLKHFSSSYSASRGALLEFWKTVNMYRGWLASDFCQPIFEEFLAEAVAKGRIKAPGFFRDPTIRKAYTGAQWNGPTTGQLDPLKEVNAAIKRVENGFSTYGREAVEMTSTDFNKNITQLKRETKALQEVREIGKSKGQ
ncbi:MAG: phage portal protein [Lachnospiraceae bacterium]|nr:phage portal protein [Lachnospiraceae bacterium]